MAIDPEIHNAIVVIDDKVHLGFPHLYSAVALIDRQVSSDKALPVVQKALSGGVEIDGQTYEIFDFPSWADAYLPEEDDVDED